MYRPFTSVSWWDGANQRFEKLCGRTLKLELNSDNTFAVRGLFKRRQTPLCKNPFGGDRPSWHPSLWPWLWPIRSTPGTGRPVMRGFFFLDEGFGSLDKESLRTVMEALWNLGKEKRVVGVISHVEEMKEEIPSFVLLSRHEEKGSLVTPSWGPVIQGGYEFN